MVRTYSSLLVERTIVLGFLSLIAAGALFLWGFGLLYGVPVSLLDSFFTATSATCVTGLAVTDTALMPFPSQVTILILIQFGGLGIMTVTTALLLFLRRRIGVREGLYLAGGLNVDSPSGARTLVLRVWGIALLIELAGAILLFIGFRETLPPLRAVWFAVFHSVSAFCNAGFSLFDGNLNAYAQGILVPGTVMLLIVLGGLGFLVLYELWRLPRSREVRLSPHAALVLQVTTGLVLFGTL
ncbi:MAG: potassium transporter TrkG, partial [Fretibacterium sp.]|nr:potassium transporter TrkG [Fretibacterium sp.]